MSVEKALTKFPQAQFFREAFTIELDTGTRYVEGGHYLTDTTGNPIMLIKKIRARINARLNCLEIKLYLDVGKGDEHPILISYITTTSPYVIEWGLGPDDGESDEIDNS